MGAPLDRRLWRGRELSRLRRARAGAADPAHRLSRRRRLGGRSPRRRRDLRPRQPTRSSARSSSPARRRRRSRRAITATSCRRRSSSSRSSSPRRCRRYVRPFEREVALPDCDFDLAIDRAGHDRRLRHQPIYAGMVAKYWIEQFARVPVDIDVASEFRYREPVLRAGRAGAVHLANRARPPTRSPRCATRARSGSGSPSSSTCRPARWRARRTCCCRPMPGPEIGVASTKAFTCQLAVLAALAANLARAQGAAEPRARKREIVAHLQRSAGRDQRRARPRRGDRRDGAPRSRRRATCSISAAARTIRWRWKAR